MSSENWAIVTGASSGIGKEIAIELAIKKYNLILVARRDDLLKILKTEIENKYQVKVETLKADLEIPSDREKVINCFNKWPVTFLVNNAGKMGRGHFGEKDLESINQMIELNVVALTHLSHAAISHFKKTTQPCVILNVGSLNSYIAAGGSAAYSATKAFVKSLSVALNNELEGTNITVSCLCPGGTESGLLHASGIKLSAKGEKFMMKADVVARIGVSAALKGKMVSVPGFSNKLSVLFSKTFPERWVTSVSSKILKSMLSK